MKLTDFCKEKSLRYCDELFAELSLSQQELVKKIYNSNKENLLLAFNAKYIGRASISGLKRYEAITASTYIKAEPIAYESCMLSRDIYLTDEEDYVVARVYTELNQFMKYTGEKLKIFELAQKPRLDYIDFVVTSEIETYTNHNSKEDYEK